MTQRKHEAPTPLPSPHAELAQDILGGVPLLLPANTVEIPDHRQPASEVALHFITQMVQTHTGVDLSTHDKPKGLSEANIRDLAALPDAVFFARELTIANNFGNNMPNLTLPTMADLPTTPRAKLQTTILDRINAHYQSFPKGLQYEPDSPLVKTFWDSFAPIAKTGVGKTAIEGLTLKLAGVTADTKTTIIASLLTSTQDLVEEFGGQLGTSTLLEFLGKDVPASLYYADEHNTSGHVRIGTHASAKAFVGNESLLIIDEGHHIVGKEFMNWLGSLSIRRPLIVTATPAYGNTASTPETTKDIRTFSESFSAGSIADMIEGKILNPTRLMEVEYDDDPVTLICEVAIPYLRDGHRVGIYCEPGKQQPERIADIINEILGERRVDWIASKRARSRAIRQEIIEGTLQGFTTCKKLGEGSNIPELNVGIFLPRGALDYEQQIGRFLRPGKRITELIQLTRRGARPGPKHYKIIGVENADPDKIIGHVPPSEDSTGQNESQPRAPQSVMPLENLPPIALTGLVRPHSEAVITGEVQEPPAGFIRLQEVAAAENLPKIWLQSVFETQDIRYALVRTEREDGTSEYERWYEPALEAWIEQNPLHELAENVRVNIPDIARMCDTTTTHIEEIMVDLGIIFNETSNLKIKYNFDTLRLVIGEVENVKVADVYDVPIGELYKECGVGLVAFATKNPALDYSIKHLRRNPVHGEKGITAHVPKEAAAKIRMAKERLDAIPFARPDIHHSIVAAARLSGIDVTTFRKRLNAEEAGLVQIMRKNTKTLPGEYLDIEDIDAIAQRLKPRPLPTSLVPPAMYKKYFGGAKAARAVAWLQDEGQELVPFPLIGVPRETLCMTWSQLEAANEEFGRAEWEQTINFKQLHGVSVREPYKTPDLQKALAYRRSVLRRYIEDDTLLVKSADDTLVPPTASTNTGVLPDFNLAEILFAEVEQQSPQPEQTEPEPEPVAELGATPKAIAAATLSQVVTVEPTPVTETAQTPTPIVPPIPIAQFQPAPKAVIEPEPATAPMKPTPVIPSIMFIEPKEELAAAEPEPEPEPKPAPESKPVAPLQPEAAVPKPKPVPASPKTEPKQPSKTVQQADEPVSDEDDTTAAEIEAKVDADYEEILKETEPALPSEATEPDTDTEDDEADPDTAGYEVDVISQSWHTTPEPVKPAQHLPVKPAPKPLPKPSQPAKSAAPPEGVPEGFVNIDGELGPFCGSAAALNMLLRSEQIKVYRKGPSRWADEDDVALLKLTIEQTPVAPHNFKSAREIADAFRKAIPALKGDHVWGVALQLARDSEDLKKHIKPYRERAADQSGKFDYHFDQTMSDKLMTLIDRFSRTRHKYTMLHGGQLPL